MTTRLPGFCDVHVHFREPGFSYKETIKSGCNAAARGGYTAVCTMPNLNPVPDSIEHLKEQLAIIEKDACIHVYPYAAITIGQKGEKLSDMEALAALSANPFLSDDKTDISAALRDRDILLSPIAFSDDGRGVQSEEMMLRAMLKAKSLGKMIVAHCEDNSLLNGGYIHDGAYAKAHGHRGICSKSEWGQIERDLALAKESGCSYHVCHISCEESVELIRKAKAEGVDVSCETAPHYLLLDENDLEENGRFKMNPPIRSAEDRRALIKGVQDGTIEIIATDHAPHSAEEKSKGLEKSAFGIVGIETAFPLLYTGLVKEDIISLEKLTELISANPRRRFGIPETNDWSEWDLEAEYTIDPAEFLSQGKATPFEGRRVYGRCLKTVCAGKVVYKV